MLDPRTERLYSQPELDAYVRVRSYLVLEDAVAASIHTEVEKARQEMREEMEDYLQKYAAFSAAAHIATVHAMFDETGETSS